MKAVKCGALDWSSLGKLLILPWWCLTFQAASSSFKHVETLTLTMLIQGTCLISAWRIKNVTQTYEYQIQHAKSTKRIKHASVKYCTSRLPASFWFIDGYRRLSHVIEGISSGVWTFRTLLNYLGQDTWSSSWAKSPRNHGVDVRTCDETWSTCTARMARSTREHREPEEVKGILWQGWSRYDN